MPEQHVEAGDYRLRVLEAEEDTSKAGHDMIRIKFRVLHDDGTEGPVIFDHLVFTDKSRWKIDHFLKACDQHPGEDVDVEIDCDKIIGWECDAALSVETFEGIKTNKVANYLWDEF